MDDDRVEGAVVVFHDVSERVKVERALCEASALLTEQTRFDGRTGIFNRRTFDEFVVGDWRRHLRSREPLGLLMIDIDFFKSFNDHYGHQAGDACLKQVARALSGCLFRPNGHVARYGGE